MRYPILALLSLILTACTTTGGTDTQEKSAAFKWPSSKGTVKIKDTVKVTGTKDYGMKTVDGSALTGDGGESENQEPPFDLTGNGAKLRNAIAKSWPESVHVHGDKTVVENVYIPDVGEDAVTSFSGVDGLTIRNCAFAKARDKIIQLNGGKNILIENCRFGPGFASAIRIKGPVGKVTIRNCTFVDGSGAVVLDKGVPTPTITGCTYSNVKYKLRKG
jgi:polygalacturonase